MLRLIHRSDLHLKADERATENRNAWMLAHHIIRQYSHAPGSPLGRDETIIVITGDLTDNASEAERQRLIEWLAFVKQFFKVLAVPGNHDYADKGLSFVEDSVELFRKVISAESFPTVWHARSEHITLIGLNSADPENYVWFAQGVIGHAQLSALGRLLKIADRRKRVVLVYLHHHPFCRDLGMPLVDSEALMACLTGQAGLILLFGHRHAAELWINHRGISHMLASGKSTEPDPNGILSYRILLIENRQVTGVYTEEFKP